MIIYRKIFLSILLSLLILPAAMAQNAAVALSSATMAQKATLEFQVQPDPQQDNFTCRAGASGSVIFRDFIASRNGNNMILHISLVLDSLKIGKNQRLVFEPIICHDGDSARYERIVVNSRVQQIRYERGSRDGLRTSDRVYRRHNGKPQTIEYIAAVPYQDWMEHYNPALRAEDCGCGKVEAVAMASIAHLEEAIPEETHRSYAWSVAYITPPATPKIYDIEKSSYIDFPVDQITLYPTYRRNPAELDSIISTINLVKNDPDVTIESITIHGYASPESPYEHNAYLAENRAKTLKDYVAKMVKLPASIWSVDFTPENWEGLREYVSESNLPHARSILAVIDGNREPDAKEWIIKST